MTFVPSLRLSRSLLVCATGILLVAGCSSRPSPAQKTLRVESATPGTEYALTGSVDVDGTKTDLTDAKTPYRFSADAVTLNAAITTTDPNANLAAVYVSAGDRELTHQGGGSNGAQVILRSEVADRITSVTIQVKPIGTPLTTATPAAPATP